MKILILGASGFIGINLSRYLEKKGHEVIAMCRSGAISNFKGECVKWHFGSRLDDIVLRNVDCAVHLAHDFNGRLGARLTIKETEKNIAELKSIGVKRQLYFSSYSAGPYAISIYGQTKYAIENLCSSANLIIIRPGLVIGNGGIYGRIQKWAGFLPIIPLPAGGKGGVPIISIDKLCDLTLRILLKKTALREYNLFEINPVSLRRLVLDAAYKKDKTPFILTFPGEVLIYILKIFEFLRVPLPINSDNLQGFISNQNAGHISNQSNLSND